MPRLPKAAASCTPSLCWAGPSGTWQLCLTPASGCLVVKPLPLPSNWKFPEDLPWSPQLSAWSRPGPVGTACLVGPLEPLNGIGLSPGSKRGLSPTSLPFAWEHSRSSPHPAHLKFSSQELVPSLGVLKASTAHSSLASCLHLPGPQTVLSLSWPPPGPAGNLHFNNKLLRKQLLELGFCASSSNKTTSGPLARGVGDHVSVVGDPEPVDPICSARSHSGRRTVHSFFVVIETKLDHSPGSQTPACPVVPSRLTPFWPWALAHFVSVWSLCAHRMPACSPGWCHASERAQPAGAYWSCAGLDGVWDRPEVGALLSLYSSGTRRGKLVSSFSSCVAPKSLTSPC